MRGVFFTVERVIAYRNIIGQQKIENILELSKSLREKRALFINSTKKGGGVAAIMHRLIPLFREVGVNADWLTINAAENDKFFYSTKSIHNALQGKQLTEEEAENVLREYQEFYLQPERFTHHNKHLQQYFAHLDPDFVHVDDPQPLALVNSNLKNGCPWIWRCHIDTAKPHTPIRDFVRGHLKKYDVNIASMPQFGEGLDDNSEWTIIQPAIDPFSDINKDMSKEEIDRIVREAGVSREIPLIVQVSRFDPWKGQEDLVEIFNHVREKTECKLVLVYNSVSGVTDDPESPLMYEIIDKARQASPYKDDIHFVVGDDPNIVNAFQRAAAVVAQPSKKEGFGLVVAEGAWKGRPVVASDVGGIGYQIEDDITGRLVQSYYDTDISREEFLRQFADSLYNIISYPEKADTMGAAGKEHIRNHFLMTRLLEDYLRLFNHLSMKKRQELEYA